MDVLTNVVRQLAYQDACCFSVASRFCRELCREATPGLKLRLYPHQVRGADKLCVMAPAGMWICAHAAEHCGWTMDVGTVCKGAASLCLRRALHVIAVNKSYQASSLWSPSISLWDSDFQAWRSPLGTQLHKSDAELASPLKKSCAASDLQRAARRWMLWREDAAALVQHPTWRRFLTPDGLAVYLCAATGRSLCLY